jgi:hypothetical protein
MFVGHIDLIARESKTLVKLVIGSIYLARGGHADSIELSDSSGTRVYSARGYDALINPQSRLLRYAEHINEVVVGFCDTTNLDFLLHFPYARSVAIMTSTVKDIQGLRHVPELRSLSIERATCRMDIIGSLSELERIHLDTWRPGAQSILELRNLRSVRIRGYPYPNLEPTRNWAKLDKLWLSIGGLESLDGVPPKLTELELSYLRKLRSIDSIGKCAQLRRFVLEGCKNLESISGLEGCHALGMLSISRAGMLATLAPIRHLSSVTYLAISDMRGVQDKQSDVLDRMANLQTCIVSKKTGIDIERVRRNSPSVETLRGTSR